MSHSIGQISKSVCRPNMRSVRGLQLMLIVTSIPDPRDLTFGSSKDMHCGAGGMRAGGMRARWHACRAERFACFSFPRRHLLREAVCPSDVPCSALRQRTPCCLRRSRKGVMNYSADPFYKDQDHDGIAKSETLSMQNHAGCKEWLQKIPCRGYCSKSCQRMHNLSLLQIVPFVVSLPNIRTDTAKANLNPSP